MFEFGNEKEELISFLEQRQYILLSHHKDVKLDQMIVHGMVLDYYKIVILNPRRLYDAILEGFSK